MLKVLSLFFNERSIFVFWHRRQNASGELPLAALHSLFPDLPSVVNMHGDGSEWLLLFPVNACLQERSPSSPSLQPVDDIRLQLLHKIQRDETLVLTCFK